GVLAQAARTSSNAAQGTNRAGGRIGVDCKPVPLSRLGRKAAFGPVSGYHARVPYVYILRCGDGSLYTGAAVDLQKRLREHAAGKASRYTRSRQPIALAWSREVEPWNEALREDHR